MLHLIGRQYILQKKLLILELRLCGCVYVEHGFHVELFSVNLRSLRDCSYGKAIMWTLVMDKCDLTFGLSFTLQGYVLLTLISVIL